ncbi:hypothetical protein NPIL_179511 [Nephila pilipes]|uniref:Uncharacterized protein n=1 Tax=Nephila pilipes TaxID=299642 RepID=A0A8X6MYC6_NEPPI|nr:hypothetical protein NPIL_179511 [Nephila pilipes]
MFFLAIFGFELVIEILNYLALEPPLSSSSETEPFVPFDQNVSNNGNKKSPAVRSMTIYRICQALELSVELASFEDSSASIKTPLARELTPLPAVYSISVFKICQALDLKVELRPQTERPTFGNRKKKPVPVVRSPTVFDMCQALGLNAHLAEF